MADLLDEKEEEIADRIEELAPAALEYDRLLTAAGALGMNLTDARATPRKRGPGRPPGKRGPGRARGSGNGRPAAKPAKAKATKAKAARKAGGPRKGSGKRGAEALAIVKEKPGITIPEIAAKMKIEKTYLYRVLPGLEAEKLVKKEGRGWYPTAKATES
jgi:hypothetical protein